MYMSSTMISAAKQWKDLNNEKISGSPARKLNNSLAYKWEIKIRVQKQLGALFIKKFMFFLFKWALTDYHLISPHF